MKPFRRQVVNTESELRRREPVEDFPAGGACRTAPTPALSVGAVLHQHQGGPDANSLVWLASEEHRAAPPARDERAVPRRRGAPSGRSTPGRQITPQQRAVPGKRTTPGK